MSKVFQFPVDPEKKKELESVNKIAQKEADYIDSKYDEPTIWDFLAFLFSFGSYRRKPKKVKKESNIVEKDNIVGIGIEKKRKTINPVIKEMFKNKEYTQNAFGHLIFDVNGQIYTFSAVELSMMGVL